MKERTCKDCRYFYQESGFEPKKTECRRNPPIAYWISGFSGRLESGWPKVEPTDWCGEWLQDS